MTSPLLRASTIRKVLAVAIGGCFVGYVCLRSLFTDFVTGASGYPCWVELGVGLVFSYGIVRWDCTMLAELGGGRFVSRYSGTFEWLGVFIGLGCLLIGASALLLFDSPPN